MKNKWKYCIAIIMAGSLGFIFMPIVEFGYTDLSASDILYLGFSENGDSMILDELTDILRTYISPYVNLLIAFLVLSVVTAVFTVVIKGRNAFIAAAGGQVVVIGIAAVFCSEIYSQVQELKNIIGFFGMGMDFGICDYTVILWVAVQIVIFGLIIVGWKESGLKSAVPVKREVMPEEFQKREDSRERMQRTVMQRRQQESPQRFPEQPDFEGAIRGTRENYPGKIYMMKDRELLYLCREQGRIVIREYEPKERACAELYFVREYQEYCLRPLAKQTVFLASGQPLGGNRLYYLPRETEIYIEKKADMFVLA